ncbi:MAG: hypothetical protein L3J65_12155 [Robiginitomaculum sp.]|nr:hypothetical protein [Robiginitomaculum sp.]
MTNDGYKIDTDLLEDGEHVLWAVGNLKPKRTWKYAVWAAMFFGVIAMLLQAYSLQQTWESMQKTWGEAGALRGVVIGMMLAGIIAGLVQFVKRKDKAPEKQSAYYVGMITNHRLVLFNADRGADYTLFPGDISSVNSDYSNGAPALRLDLMNGEPPVTIVTSANLSKAKQLIESGFLTRHAVAAAQ